MLVGCNDQPQAPALVQGLAEYHDEQHGFRFAPPAKWFQQKRSDYPSGHYEKEMVLIQYRSIDEGNAGVFRVSMVDLTANQSVAEYLSSRPAGVEGWSMVSAVEPTQAAGQRAERATYNGVWAGRAVPQSVTKEVVAVRRGERVYFITGIFAAGDTNTKTVLRKALASVTWDETVS